MPRGRAGVTTNAAAATAVDGSKAVAIPFDGTEFGTRVRRQLQLNQSVVLLDGRGSALSSGPVRQLANLRFASTLSAVDATSFFPPAFCAPRFSPSPYYAPVVALAA